MTATASAFARIELRYLAALRAVAETGTFGAAAAKLGYAQSTVSHQIAALERAVGGTMFDRPGGPRPVRITPLGKLVLLQAEELLARAETAATAIERFKSGEGRLDVGTFQTASNAILPLVLGRLRDERPAIDIHLVEEGSAVELLLGGDLDLLFWDVPFWGQRKDLRIEHRELVDDPYVIVARPGEFADGPVPLEKLDGAPMVAHPCMYDQPVVRQALVAADARPSVAFRASDNSAVLAMVRAGLGSALMPLLAVGLDHADRDLRIHDIAPSIPPRKIFVAWLAGQTLSPAARRAVDIAVEVGNGLAAPETRRR